MHCKCLDMQSVYCECLSTDLLKFKEGLPCWNFNKQWSFLSHLQLKQPGVWKWADTSAKDSAWCFRSFWMTGGTVGHESWAWGGAGCQWAGWVLNAGIHRQLVSATFRVLVCSLFSFVVVFNVLVFVNVQWTSLETALVWKLPGESGRGVRMVGDKKGV